jgi:hypothetical protein
MRLDVSPRFHVCLARNTPLVSVDRVIFLRWFLPGKSLHGCAAS